MGIKPLLTIAITTNNLVLPGQGGIGTGSYSVPFEGCHCSHSQRQTTERKGCAGWEGIASET
jgi:hypothetical protein